MLLSKIFNYKDFSTEIILMTSSTEITLITTIFAGIHISFSKLPLLQDFKGKHCLTSTKMVANKKISHDFLGGFEDLPYCLYV